MRYILILMLIGLYSCKAEYNPDNDPDVIDWYVDGNDTIIYTKQDSIRDQRARWEYIRSIEHDSLWE
jgi:beta-glucanase (GH16 family)